MFDSLDESHRNNDYGEFLDRCGEAKVIVLTGFLGYEGAVADEHRSLASTNRMTARVAWYNPWVDCVEKSEDIACKIPSDTHCNVPVSRVKMTTFTTTHICRATYQASA